MKININPNDMTEFVGQIIDIFEDFLEARGIDIPNEDKELAIKSGEDPNGLCIIYGMDYGELQASIEDTLNNWAE